MTRGTTPTFTFTFDEIDNRLIKYAEMTISQNGENIIIKKLIQDEDTYSASLSEEESLSLKDGLCRVQVKIKLKDNNVVATNIETITVNEILNGGVML